MKIVLLAKSNETITSVKIGTANECDDLAICRRTSREVTSSGGQASKGIRWMPWYQEAMKDVAKLRKATVSRMQASTRRSPNRETGRESCRGGLRLNS